jgi:hypothetical protein
MCVCVCVCVYISKIYRVNLKQFMYVECLKKYEENYFMTLYTSVYTVSLVLHR